MNRHPSQALIPGQIYSPIMQRLNKQPAYPNASTSFIATTVPVVYSAGQYLNQFATNVARSANRTIEDAPGIISKNISDPRVISGMMTGKAPYRAISSTSRDMAKNTHKKEIAHQFENDLNKEAKTTFATDISLTAITSANQHGTSLKGYQKIATDVVKQAPNAAIAAATMYMAPIIGEQVAPDHHPVAQSTLGAGIAGAMGYAVKVGKDALISNQPFLNTAKNAAKRGPSAILLAASAAGYKAVTDIAAEKGITKQDVVKEAVANTADKMAKDFSSVKNAYQNMLEQVQPKTELKISNQDNETSPKLK